MNRAEWLAHEIEKNRRRMADLRQRTQELEKQLYADSPDPLLDALLHAHRRVEKHRTEDTLEARRSAVTVALAAGYSKYRLSRVLNVTPAMIYHYLDPDYRTRNRT